MIDFSDREASDRFERQRHAIVQENRVRRFLQSENLFCDLSRGVYFDHWVTPEIYSMRFDTRFYIAELPAHQVPLTHSEEVTHSLWIRPEEAIGRIHRPDFPILPPTTTVLQKLARLGSWERLCGEFNFVSDPPAQRLIVAAKVLKVEAALQIQNRRKPYGDG